jgi:hypothetical protein
VQNITCGVVMGEVVRSTQQKEMKKDDLCEREDVVMCPVSLGRKRQFGSKSFIYCKFT